MAEWLRIVRTVLGLGRPVQPALLWIEEDSLDEIQVLPEGSSEWAKSELAKIAGIAEAHALPDGDGYTEIHMRSSAPVRLSTLGLSFDEVTRVLKRRLPVAGLRTPNPYVDWHPSPRVAAFGHQGAAVIVAQYDQGCVEAIDLQLEDDERSMNEIVGALGALKTPAPLIVIDWLRGQMARLDRPDEMARLLRNRVPPAR